ncbi:septum site-determining protein Ssd [Nocardioides panaciterrulae]|uniref:Secretion/DNA translocation related CpaE-like protein n=1 Tax=Nocardioides panaciterrulae TaxID=661492 RepID=A0A7Y9JC82_9ACTN|nr:septum site-determining protein Ssd [Nocardioides panaciterrulae]NYD43612.1 secretion/DNA translocation related CpaE-like protein [Nocardioides panaciterrulae]
MTSPLFVTRDPALLDELLRLAAAAGVSPDVADDAAAALRGWAAAPLVVVGADLAGQLAAVAPPRRAAVHLAGWSPVSPDLFRLAVEVGAESVTTLPDAAAWLVERLTDLGDPEAARGLLLGVAGGAGGAGATTFACALAQVAARTGPALVVDADPLGPGVDRVLGLESREGIRWDALSQTTGRLSARSLRDAVPRRDGVGALTWYAGATAALDARAVREALSAARRGHDTVVVDLPRASDALVDEVVARCDRLLVLVVPTVAGVASAARLCARFADATHVALVLRGRGIDPGEVARVAGTPVLARMADQRGLAETIDLGLGPVRSWRGPLGRAAAEVLESVVRPRVAA